MTFTPPFGQWLKQRRRSLDLTQEDLARQVGYSPETLRKVEAGIFRPSRQAAEILADRMHIEAGDRASFIAFARGAEVPGWRAPLPTPSSSLVGRAGDVEQVKDLLRRDDVRLLSLVGPPGVGKTRLALEVAHQLNDLYDQRVCFVALASVSDSRLVASAIADALEIRGEHDQPIQDALVRYLMYKPHLVVLDNFEHLLPAAPLVAELLEYAPGLKVLTTSRALLHVRGEYVYEVQPLPVPDIENLPAIDELCSYPAIELFMQRARQVRPAFALTRANARAVVGLCRSLDGLPLAIELVVARLRAFTPQTIATQLDHHLGAMLQLLTLGPSDLPPHQRTLRAAIDWSYSVLNMEEQQLFRRLSVFAGGCTLEAAQAIYDVDSPVTDLMQSLVDKSLVQQVEGPDGDSRYLLLETLRAFALEQLGAQDAGAELEEVRQRHGRFFAHLCDLQNSSPTWPLEPTAIIKQLIVERDNLRSALIWSREVAADPSLHLDITSTLAWMGIFASENLGLRCDTIELEAELEWSLARNPQLPALKRGRRLLFLGMLASRRDDFARAGAIYAESMALCRAAGDPGGEASATNLAGWLAYLRGDLAQSERHMQHQLELGRQMGAIGWIVHATGMLGALALARGDATGAEPLLTEARSVYSKLKVRIDLSGSEAMIVQHLGALACLRGDFGGAYQLLEQAWRMFVEAAEPIDVARLHLLLGHVALVQGRLYLAEQHARDALNLYRECSFLRNASLGVALLARVAMLRGENAYLVRLAGYVAAHPTRRYAYILTPDAQEMIEIARSHLSDPVLVAAWDEGQAMDLESVIASVVVADAPQ